MDKAMILLLIAITCGASTCKKDKVCEGNGHPGLTIVNEANHRIHYAFYWNYPDTLIGEYNPVNDGTDGLSPGESFTQGAGMGSCWESVFQNNKQEWIYLFDADTIEQVEWDVVRTSNRGLLERRQIDLGYLEQHNFSVTYN